MHPVHALFRFLPATQALQRMDEGLRLLHPDPCLRMLSCMGHSTRRAAYLSRKGYLSMVHTQAHCSYLRWHPSSLWSNQRTLTLSCRWAYPLSLTCHSNYSRLCMTLREAHMAAPSVPSCSSSQVLRTSCCMSIRYCILQGLCTGRWGYKDMDTPMSLYHKSFHEARSVDVFRSLSRFRHSMQ